MPVSISASISASSPARVLVTGSAGFIGFHLCRLLLAEGVTVHGFDGMTDYYDVGLKRARHALLAASPRFSTTEALIEADGAFDVAARAFAPDMIVHLAAQAGVRYSLDNPRAYIDANITGTYAVLEAARALRVGHLMLASTSSVYGANTDMPYAETHKADTPMSFYAATKKAGEAMSHAYAHLHRLPVTCFRFFTVYGPWGRPDMAAFKFTDAILRGDPIDVYNYGEMRRDFTYVGDLVRGVRLLMDAVPAKVEGRGPETHTPETAVKGDSLSPVAPWRVVNIGNGAPVRLGDFIDAIEAATGRVAQRNLMPIQPGDVPATWADASLLTALTGYRPQTDIRDGMAEFVAWFRDYYAR
jgi:UDP-glucuronate 4-epimerase